MLRLKLEVIEETWVNGTEYMCEVWGELQQELAMLEDLRTSWPVLSMPRGTSLRAEIETDVVPRAM